MPEKVRIGAVSYLNTRPLVLGIEQGLGAGRIELSYAVPSRLTEQMQQGRLDVALLPTIELARIPDLELIPGLGIVTRGPSRSVLLICKRPIERVASVALDPESRTSNALTRVLFHEVWGLDPSFSSGPLELDSALRSHDAAVRIGDKALFERIPSDLEVHDLGEVWTRASGLPFVFAGWSARAGVVDRELYRLLHRSRREGSKQIDLIAEAYVWKGNHYPELSRRYLMEHIHYRLGAAEIRAIKLFLRSAHSIGLVDHVPEIKMALQRWTTCHESAARENLTSRTVG